MLPEVQKERSENEKGEYEVHAQDVQANINMHASQSTPEGKIKPTVNY